MGRYRLPAPSGDAATQRLRAFLTDTWPGRILVGALAVFVAGLAGVPLPSFVIVVDRLLLLVFGGWFLFRFGRFLLRTFLWRIRRKLILSYLFIAVVPLVLLVSLFLLAGLLFSGLVGSYMVATEIDEVARSLQATAQGALVDLPMDAPARKAALERRLAVARSLHPGLRYVLTRDGRALESTSSAVPPALPSWITAPGFAGLVKGGEGRPDVVRAVWIEGPTSLDLEVPLDQRLFAPFERRTGLHLLTMGGTVNASGGDIDIEIGDRKALGQPSEVTGMAFLAAPERVDWATGRRDNAPLTFSYEPFALVRRLSTGSLNMADLLVKAFTVLAVVFLVVYAFALLLGLLLARSITRSIHALSVGTERLRAGDLTHRIPVSSRDQLGELAESFNTMSQGIQDLLRQQAEKERLEEELRIARSIQMSLLPTQGSVSLPALRIAALCLPAAEVGGDYYDLIPLSETRMGVLIADVSGKGTSAALYMAELKGLVLSLARIYASPAQLLTEANSILADTMDSRSFVTMTYAVVDGGARTMRYARAGHNPILHLEASTRATHVLMPQGIGLGIDRGQRFAGLLEEAEVPLRPGDVFLFFTDGLSEAMNGRSELFGERRLRDILERSEGLGSDQVKEAILGEIRAFVGDAPQQDDMTLVVLEVA
jgi:sigma-B regulation protein RsbU (phosphoserine phosphatase)